MDKAVLSNALLEKNDIFLFLCNRSVGQDAGFPRTQTENTENEDRARHDLTGDRKFSRRGDFMP